MSYITNRGVVRRFDPGRALLRCMSELCCLSAQRVTFLRRPKVTGFLPSTMNRINRHALPREQRGSDGALRGQRSAITCFTTRDPLPSRAAVSLCSSRNTTTSGDVPRGTSSTAATVSYRSTDGQFLQLASKARREPVLAAVRGVRSRVVVRYSGVPREGTTRYLPG